MDLDDEAQLEKKLETMNLSREEKRAIRRRWRLSLWRILPLPIISYTIVGTYLWIVNTPDAWQRAAAPVLAILTFTTLSPFIRNFWFKRMKQKVVQRNRLEREDSLFDDE